VVSPKFLGVFDVAVLRALVSTDQQNHDLIAFATEVHPIAGSKVDAKFEYPVPDRAGVSEVSQPNPSNSLTNLVAGRSVTKTSKPQRERLAAVRTAVDANFLLGRHRGNVAYTLLLPMAESGREAGFGPVSHRPPAAGNPSSDG